MREVQSCAKLKRRRRVAESWTCGQSTGKLLQAARSSDVYVLVEATSIDGVDFLRDAPVAQCSIATNEALIC